MTDQLPEDVEPDPLAVALSEHIISVKFTTCSCGLDLDRFGWRTLWDQHLADIARQIIRDEGDQ